MKSRVRAPAVAGLFYPKDAEGLRRTLRALLAAPRAPREAARAPKALVVPHAGYAYSGSVAAAAYRSLDEAAGKIRHVVLIGPSHRVPMRGLAMPGVDFFATPCGEIPIDDRARQHLRELGLAGISDAPHAAEHSLEVQLPFLQAVLSEFDVLPIAVGLTPPGQVARALEAVWGEEDTLIVVSSDLSHYHTHSEAQQLDGLTTRAILERRSDLSDEQACGAACINGLMEVARRKALKVELLDQRTSADTAGDRSRVVGYGSYVLYPA
ncbi:MAG TPA: AmmeMemoRadiSam system protein B [Steroidobacteraceae bacterium]|nr:AmmeMemoRadiSam system protein B [Steroidobacteraceae bacterium]